jgi:SAM-dependent methyltransferase
MARGLDLDDPATTDARRAIIRSKPFLRAIYEEWYDMIEVRLPAISGAVLELGSGAGFISDRLPGVITSDVFGVSGIDVVSRAEELPFAAESLRAIVMTNVFHHIPNVAVFLNEADRCLRVGGRIVMIEPWNTGWSRFVHKHFHDEVMDIESEEWAFPSSGPLSSANAALAWIVTERDRDRLRLNWPRLHLLEATPFMPFRYVLSGGLSVRSLQPFVAFGLWRSIDMSPLFRRFALFAVIVVERRAVSGGQQVGSR